MDSAAGLTAAGLKGLHAAAERHVGDDTVPGLVASPLAAIRSTSRRGRSRSGAAHAARVVFRIASTTKPITAAATLALVGEGSARARGAGRPAAARAGRPPGAAPHGRVARGHGPRGAAITARDLLTFTFGFGMVSRCSPRRAVAVVEARDELQLATFGPPDPRCRRTRTPGSPARLAAAGRPTRASDGCTTPARRSSASCSPGPPGEPLGEVLRTRLFEPLGMRDTAFWTPAVRPARDGLPAHAGRAGAGRPDGRGAVRRRSPTARRGWCRPSTTCSPLRGCCCAAARRCSRPTRCGR